MIEPTYVPLWVHSNYSFLQGASHPEELVDQAQALGLTTFALTDRDGLYGLVRAAMRARGVGIKVVAGAQITVNDKHVLVLAKNRTGYGQLCQLISLGRNQCSKGSAQVSLQQVNNAGTDLLLLCPDAQLLKPLKNGHGDRLYAFCARHRIPEESHKERDLLNQSRQLQVKVVAGNQVLYHNVNRRPLQDVLTCIGLGLRLEQAGKCLKPNAEHALKSCQAMGRLFVDMPDALERTLEVAEACTFSIDQLRYRYPSEDHSDGRIRTLTFQGAHRRYGQDIPQGIEKQIERELELVAELDYGGYFLTMYEIVQFCREKAILCQGRGSAANSVVCYCLGITAIDPIQMDLLFERFISRERAEPPDIDLDIEHQRREEVIQWLYHRYGRRHAAMVANVVRFRTRSAVREVGKVLGLHASAIDRMAKISNFYEATFDPKTFERAGLDVQAPIYKHFLQRVQEVLDFPRHLSIHPGGFILGHEPVDTLVPIEPATMENRTVIQWDKQDVEDLGLFKVDLLGLGALTHVHSCFDLIAQTEGKKLTMTSVPQEDTKTYEMISKGDTVGVFQIESRAQMSMLPRLKPRTFYDLVVEVAIMRPGPIQGDMVHPYLRRRTLQEKPDYPHASFRKVLEKTYGVPIFQEQVMKIAMLAADYTPGEADQLRRDMAAWRSAGRIEKHHDKLIQRMTKRGIPPDFAERIFAQIRGFGEYGFPESHAASFALIAYVTAWLKCHHHAAFTCALLNAQPMGFYSAATVVDDAKRHGVNILPVDVNYSEWTCTLQKSASGALSVRMGFCYVKGFGVIEKNKLTKRQGKYTQLSHFVQHTNLSQKSLMSLAEAGAYDSLKISRRDALWSLRDLATTRHDSLQLPQTVQQNELVLSSLSASDAVLWDLRTSFHSARGHPLAGIRSQLHSRGVPTALAVHQLRHKTRLHFVGLVICRQRPQTASGVTFLTLEDETGMVNVVIWKQVFDAHLRLVKTAILLEVSGTIQAADGVVHLLADHLREPTERLTDLSVQSHDFH